MKKMSILKGKYLPSKSESLSYMTNIVALWLKLTFPKVYLNPTLFGYFIINLFLMAKIISPPYNGHILSE